MATAAILKSAFVSPFADSGDATRFGPTAQNAAHLFTAGNAGDVLVRDATTLTGAAWVAPGGVAFGGTGIASYTVGDLLYASAAAVLSKLADVAVGSVLASGGVGVAPAWSATPTLTSLTILGPGAGATLTNPSTNLWSLNGNFAAGQVQVGSGSYIGIVSRGWWSGSADGKLILENNGLTSGFGVDLTTDSLFKLRTRAHTGYATLDCLGLKASGVAGASFGPAAVVTLTVVNGIVTAVT